MPTVLLYTGTEPELEVRRDGFIVNQLYAVVSAFGSIAQLAKVFLCVSQPRRHNRMVVRQIKWEKSEQGWWKLNTDGSWNAAVGSTAGGGLIRDSWGNWVTRFTRKLGNANSFTVEVWALRDGLMLCVQRKFLAVIVEIDAKALVDAFNNTSYCNSVISPIFDDCKHLILQIPQVCIKHVYREANKCADWLANSGHSLSLDFIVHSVPPVSLIPTVEADCNGSWCNRLCPELSFSSQLNNIFSLPKKKRFSFIIFFYVCVECVFCW